MCISYINCGGAYFASINLINWYVTCIVLCAYFASMKFLTCIYIIICELFSLNNIIIIIELSMHVQGQVCPNEAEFCGYDILLHLTDGNVLK